MPGNIPILKSQRLCEFLVERLVDALSRLHFKDCSRNIEIPVVVDEFRSRFRLASLWLFALRNPAGVRSGMVHARPCSDQVKDGCGLLYGQQTAYVVDFQFRHGLSKFYFSAFDIIAVHHRKDALPARSNIRDLLYIAILKRHAAVYNDHKPRRSHVPFLYEARYGLEHPSMFQHPRGRIAQPSQQPQQK